MGAPAALGALFHIDSDRVESDIFVAVANDDLPQLRRLLSDPATEVDALDWFRLTALCRAAELGQFEATSLLVEAGARLAVSGQRYCGLAAAAAGGHVDIVALLLEEFNDPNIRVENDPAGGHRIAPSLRALYYFVSLSGRMTCWPGASPLHYAAICGRYGIVKLILARLGADPNIEDAIKATPLHAAAVGSRHEIVRLLLDAGADPCARMIQGFTPRPYMCHDSAIVAEHNRTVALLVAAGDRAWAAMPGAFPGLETALLVVWKDAPDELPLLFRRLTPAVQARALAALAALHRGSLPVALRMELLAEALTADATFE